MVLAVDCGSGLFKVRVLRFSYNTRALCGGKSSTMRTRFGRCRCGLRLAVMSEAAANQHSQC
jgi:hypothetical protein